MRKLLLFGLLCAAPLFATTYTVKAGGGNYRETLERMGHQEMI
jgi:hypothetical protein